MKYILTLLLLISFISCDYLPSNRKVSDNKYKPGDTLYVDTTKVVISKMDDFVETKANRYYYWVKVIDSTNNHWEVMSFQVVEYELTKTKKYEK